MSAGPDDPKSSDSHLSPQLYDELRRIANRSMDRGGDLTIQPTELVHEAFLKVAKHADDKFNDQVHFKAVAATAMRQILIDHLRGRRASKRGGDLERVTLGDLPDHREALDLEELDAALTKLAEVDERAARIVEMKFFGGMTEGAIAKYFGVSDRTIRNDWTMARAWLRSAQS